MNCALLLAAGSGNRMRGAVEDKILATIAGKAALAYSLEAFAQSGCVDAICIVYRDSEQRKALEKSIPQSVQNQIRFLWATGGSERQDSVRNGLAELPKDTELVFIHDSARPLIKPSAIQQLSQMASRDGAACLAHPVTDTIKRIPLAEEIEKTSLEDLERNRLWAMETPQAFQYTWIHQAYEQVSAKKLQITDDTAAVALLGKKITLVPNSQPNPKITTATDLDYIEWLLQR